MIFRLAAPGDEALLAKFRCLPDAIDDDDADDDRDEDGVEHFFRTEAMGWFLDPTRDGPRLILATNYEGDLLLGAAAHEGCVEPVYGRFVVAVAVATGHQDVLLGRTLLLAALRDCTNRAPGGVATWLVRRSNDRSVRMCQAIGAAWQEEPDTDGELLRFKMDLPSLYGALAL